MDAILSVLTTLFNLALVVVGFGLIVFVHELGHFLAAKWARIRVLAFALGFGPAIVSYRKGMGLRRGSTEREYREILRRAEQERGGPVAGGVAAGVSPTEYRLNVLPLGGYVKMLGQEDLDPGATSAASDSYNACHPAKRLVVISAGVLMNLIVAGALFVLVFLVGLERQPPRVGALTPGGAAASATAIDPGDEPGRGVLMPGDRVVGIDGRRPSTFDDLILSAAMGTRTTPVRLAVERDGVEGRLEFNVLPRPGVFDGLLDFGIEPYRSNRLFDPGTRRAREARAEALASVGLAGVRPGSTLESADGVAVSSAHDLMELVRRGGGAAVELVFSHDGEPDRTVRVAPVAELQTGLVAGPGGTMYAIEHLLGLVPVMTVEDAEEGGRGYRQGLRTGDVFERVGSVEFPTLDQGIAEIKAHRGRSIDLVVRRAVERDPGEEAWPDEDLHRDAHQRVTIQASVSRQGLIGFVPGTVADRGTIVGLPPPQITPIRADAEGMEPAATRVITRPGVRVLSVEGVPVGTFTELRESLREATLEARREGRGAVVRLGVERLMAEGAAAPEEIDWSLTPTEVASLHELSWQPRFGLGAFELESFVLRASGPGEAVRTGIAETHRVMMSTYLTLLRLFQGTVRVEHLKGPVGITHMGTLVADRGVVWLLFFFALVSVNLAVINFLPLPIVDGGQFLMIIYEWVRGRPVPIGLQNALTLAGLVLIGSVFLVVTFNDVAKLLGG